MTMTHHLRSTALLLWLGVSLSACITEDAPAEDADRHPLLLPADALSRG